MSVGREGGGVRVNDVLSAGGAGVGECDTEKGRWDVEGMLRDVMIG
jgi:hypothetical protein